MIMVAMLFIFIYIVIECIFLYVAANAVVLETTEQPIKKYIHWSFRWLYWGLSALLILTVLSLMAAMIGIKSSSSKNINYTVPINITKNNNVMESLLWIIGIFIVIQMVVHAMFNIKSNIFLYGILIAGLAYLLYQYDQRYMTFNNNMYTKYAKTSLDANKDLKNYLTDTKYKDKMSKYIISNIKQHDPSSTLTSYNDIAKPPYDSMYYAYIMHKEGNETFDDTGTLDSVAIGKFKTSIVTYFNHIDLNKGGIEADFKLSLSNIHASSSNLVGLSSETYSIGYYNQVVRKYIVDVIYTADQQNAVIGTSAVTSILSNYKSHLITDGKILTSLFTESEYLIRDDPHGRVPNGGFAKKSCSSVLQHALDSGTIKDPIVIDDILNVITLENTTFDYLSINLSNTIKKIEAVKDTLSNESVIGLYSVMDTFQQCVQSYRSKNVADLKLQTAAANLRAIDINITSELNKILSFIFWVNVFILIFTVYVIFHKIYRANSGAMQMYLPLMTIVGIASIVWYAWMMGNLNI